MSVVIELDDRKFMTGKEAVPCSNCQRFPIITNSGDQFSVFCPNGCGEQFGPDEESTVLKWNYTQLWHINQQVFSQTIFNCPIHYCCKPVVEYEKKQAGYSYFVIYCQECGKSTAQHTKTIVGAISAWNLSTERICEGANWRRKNRRLKRRFRDAVRFTAEKDRRINELQKRNASLEQKVRECFDWAMSAPWNSAEIEKNGSAHTSPNNAGGIEGREGERDNEEQAAASQGASEASNPQDGPFTAQARSEGPPTEQTDTHANGGDMPIGCTHAVGALIRLDQYKNVHTVKEIHPELICHNSLDECNDFLCKYHSYVRSLISSHEPKHWSIDPFAQKITEQYLED